MESLIPFSECVRSRIGKLEIIQRIDLEVSTEAVVKMGCSDLPPWEAQWTEAPPAAAVVDHQPCIRRRPPFSPSAIQSS